MFLPRTNDVGYLLAYVGKSVFKQSNMKEAAAEVDSADSRHRNEDVVSCPRTTRAFRCALVAGESIGRRSGEGPSSVRAAAHHPTPGRPTWTRPDHDLPQHAGRCAGRAKGSPVHAVRRQLPDILGTRCPYACILSRTVHGRITCPDSYQGSRTQSARPGRPPVAVRRRLSAVGRRSSAVGRRSRGRAAANAADFRVSRVYRLPTADRQHVSHTPVKDRPGPDMTPVEFQGFCLLLLMIIYYYVSLWSFFSRYDGTVIDRRGFYVFFWLF
ncbi:hypothetical protein QTP88_015202 [Uroleucon formosanum]